MFKKIFCVSSAVFFLSSFSLSVYADDVNALKIRIQELEAENQELRATLGVQKAEPEQPQVVVAQKPYEEKSIANALGLAPKNKPLIKGGFIDFNYYYDDRDLNVFTINLLAMLPWDIQYFSLNNMSSSSGSGNNFDLSGYFMENHFRRPIAKNHKWLAPLDWTVQFVDGSSAKQLVRLGTRVRTQDIAGPIGEFVKSLGLWVNVDFHWYESDGEGMEIEPVYGGKYFDDFLIVEGFADIDFNQKNEINDKIVTEHQVGIRIVDNLYYVTEFKYNGNRGDGDRWSTAFGLKYTVPFGN